jgi:hypothetical protein
LRQVGWSLCGIVIVPYWAFLAERPRPVEADASATPRIPFGLLQSRLILLGVGRQRSATRRRAPCGGADAVPRGQRSRYRRWPHLPFAGRIPKVRRRIWPKTGPTPWNGLRRAVRRWLAMRPMHGGFHDAVATGFTSTAIRLGVRLAVGVDIGRRLYGRHQAAALAAVAQRQCVGCPCVG